MISLKKRVLFFIFVVFVWGSLLGYGEDGVVKFIFSGGPSSGKTTTLLYLEVNYDEVTVPESAADVQLILRAQGNAEPWKDEGLNEKILSLQHKRLARVNACGGNKGRVLLDRSPIDILAYEDNPSKSLLDTIELIRNDDSYAKIVFVLKQIGHVEKTLYRYEDENLAHELEIKQVANYRKYGFEVVFVRFDTIENRAKYIESVMDQYMDKKKKEEL